MRPDQMAPPYSASSNEVDEPKFQENQQVRQENDQSPGGENCKIAEKKIGGWKVATVLLVNQALATLAFFGVGVNLVMFLTRVLGQSNAEAANNVSKWTGTVYAFSVIGAFLSDSYWGRFLTCSIFQLIFVVGLGLLSLSSWLFLINPLGCGAEEKPCHAPSTLGVVTFYLSIYLVAFGYGGHQPTLATLGSDQYDEKIPRQKKSKEAFFFYFYVALNVGSLVSNTVLVYYEDTGNWTLGFGVSLASAVIAFLSYLCGTPWYRYVKASGNPVVRIAQVFMAAAKKWGIESPGAEDLYEVEGPGSAIKGSRKIQHTDGLKFLDKAATVTKEEVNEPIDPWRLCTVTQVEEAKSVLRMLPVWLCTIIYSIVFTQMASLFVEQGDVMHAYIGDFKIPAASMTVFDIFSVVICTAFYRQIMAPIAGRLSGNPSGLTALQRMGIGIIVGMLAMVAAGITEIMRLRKVTPGTKYSSLSIFCQAPQYILVGCSEIFMYVGQLDFFNGQAPDGIKSLGSSLCMASIALGNFVSSLLVTLVMAITARDGKPGWIPNNLNRGHLDRFYFLIAILSAIDFVIYLFCAKWYKSINVYEGEEDEASIELQGSEHGSAAADRVINRV
ncbi:hypothetical protein QN277_027421 [Acacia crassicarpa]|uniref:Uncharacterized protein n=2 Tax=Acacia crassicarpa TaxID=499986 RepID=A0AAE1J9S9_9FABA|nr:hypothetical protein QN277_027421 [Acacia crassicarpa]